MSAPEVVGDDLSASDAESMQLVGAELVEAPAASEGLVEVLNPITGALVPVGDIGGIAEAIQMLRQRKRDLDGFIEAFTGLAVQESRRQGTRTLRGGDYELSLSSDHEIEWDIGALNEGLATAGCPEERIYELITATVTYKVNRKVANQLSASNEQYRAAIEAAQTRVPSKPYTTVKPR
jgi:hypothetical protein